MPREQMDIQQVADYLHLDTREVTKLASRGQIPCRKVAGRFVFTKGEVDHWVETQMHDMKGERLARIEKGVSAHHGFDHEEMLVGPLIPPGPHGIAVPLEARTREGVLRALVEIADRADLVYARDELTDEIRKREELCSTAVAPAVAMPHPRYPLPYDIAASFVVVGLTPSGIPFGSPTGKLTRLFFLICCKDDRTHLHVLARLARILDSQEVVERFLAAGSAEELRRLLVEREQQVLEAMRA
jgi:PTS system nitrogen regulatory IIA component